MKALDNNPKPGILKEQFIPDHVFVYVAKGGLRFMDGDENGTLLAGQCGLARKNRLARFELLPTGEDFEPYVFCFDEAFLQEYLHKHPQNVPAEHTRETFIRIPSTSLLDDFIYSVKPYHKGFMQLEEAFEDLKYEELLLILLRTQPDLAGILFNFSQPAKINLEAFMNQNFRFNVSLTRFAYLTGRSISAFKRDFKAIFKETPARWLVRKRLHEAHFLLQNQHQSPSKIYLDLGFESLSHFSAAFKKEFGIVPTAAYQS